MASKPFQSHLRLLVEPSLWDTTAMSFRDLKWLDSSFSVSNYYIDYKRCTKLLLDN